MAPLIKLTNVDSEYSTISRSRYLAYVACAYLILHSAPHLEQPVELSDSRPSGKSEEKPSLENTPATSSENVFVRGDSDDRGDMYDIVSDCKTPAALLPTFRVQADIIFDLQWQEKTSLFLNK